MAPLTQEDGGVDGSSSGRMDFGQPEWHETSPADDAQVPRLAQHGNEQRRHDTHACPHSHDVAHPSPTYHVLEGRREGSVVQYLR